MQKPCQLALIGASVAVLAACSTTPPQSEGSQAQTKRVCVNQEASSGSRLSRRVCRKVEKKPEEKATEEKARQASES